MPAARRVRAGEGAEGGDRPAGALPHPRHQRHRRGERAGGGRRRRRCGRRRHGCHERAYLAAEPRLDRRGAALRAARPRHRSRPAAAHLRLLGAGAPLLRAPSRATSAPAPRRSTCMGCPAGSTRTCASRRARSASTRRAGRRSRRTYAEVNDMFGDIIKVTPTSKVVGDMALLMVSGGPLPRAGARSRHEDRLPGIRGAVLPRRAGPALRRLPAGAAAQGAQGRAPLSGRPGAALPPVDLDAERARIQQQLPRPVTDEDLASYLMYPRVWLEYAARARAVRRPGDPADPVFFYGMEPGAGDQRRPRARQDAHRALHREQRAARGRHAHGVLRAQRPAALGARARQSQVARRPPPRKIEPGNPRQVGAPMPGVSCERGGGAGRAGGAG